MSQAELALRVNQAAAADGVTLSTHERQIRRWEGDVTVPRRDVMKWMAVALGMPAGDLVALFDRKGSGAPVLEPIGPDYIDTIHRRTDELMKLEVQQGGSKVLPMASHYVGELRNRLAIASNQSFNPELWSAGAGLVATAAWMAHDADDRDGANRLSLEALFLSQLAGDRQVELRTLSNFALYHLYNGRPQEALAIARRTLATPLTEYQRAMFRTREARALAALGAEAEATRIVEEVVNASTAGPSPTSAEYWWFNLKQVPGSRALVLEATGQYERAYPFWQELTDSSDPTWQGAVWAGQRYLRFQRLFRGAVKVGDWRTAEDTVGQLLSYVSTVRSGRVNRWLIQSLRELKQIDRAPSSLRMSGQQLGAALQL